MSCHFIHLLQVSKKCLWSLILCNFFHDLTHVYSSGAGADSPQGTKFWCQQKGLITFSTCCKFQRNLFEVWFYTFLSYSSGAGGHTDPRGQSFDVNRKALSLSPFVASFKRISLKCDFIHFCHIAPGQGAYSPQGIKFWCQQKLLVTSVICC